MKTLLYTNSEAAEAAGLTEATVKSYCNRYLKLDVDYIVHERMVARLTDGAMLRRQQRFITEAGVQKLCYRQFGRLYERRAARRLATAQPLVSPQTQA